MPRPELGEFVQAYAQREMDCGVGVFWQPNICTLEQGIVFQFDGVATQERPDGRSSLLNSKTWVFGAVLPPCGGARFTGHVHAFGIFLKPHVFWQLFRIPTCLLTDKEHFAEDLLGKDILDVYSIMAECKTFQQRVRAAEEYLLPFAMQARGRTLILKTAQYMAHCKGAVRVEEIAYQAAMSVRQYERRFSEEMGMTPKHFARTTRFQRAVDAKRLFPKRSWLSIAHELGYFDQMHMVRDFRSLGGGAPNNVLEQSGDIQPWSLGSHKELALG
jgi:AraC-like DNA-binding protein